MGLAFEVLLMDKSISDKVYIWWNYSQISSPNSLVCERVKLEFCAE